jgi:hypothetical protein
LDSNIFDKIISDKEVKNKILILKRSNKMKIFTTHIQLDELNATPNETKRKKLVECAKEISECIPTMGVVIGVSKVGMARISNGEEIQKIRQNQLKMTRDSLISSTASSDADFLVTDDEKFAKRVKQELKNITVLKYDDFVKILNG